METIENVVCVLTARGIERILEEGGTQAWVLDAKRARKCTYVVCVQNRGFPDDWGQASADHHTAFIVGRISDVVRSTDEPNSSRWLLRFSEFAEIDIPEAWPGNRNPVFYSTLEHFGLDIAKLAFEAMPPIEQADESKPALRGLTLAEAKAGVAITYGVSPSDVKITVQG